MAIQDLEIDLLRAFVAVAEAGSFTAGADIVGRTQSAVSQKILRLEEILGRRVFERSSRSLSLTLDGERLMGPARQMLEFNNETVRQFIEPPVVGTLRLGVADDFIPHQLPRLLSGAEDQIDDNVRRKSAQLPLVIGEPVPVSLDLYNPRAGNTNRGATVKHPDLMSATEQFIYQG